MGGQGLHPPADACDYARHCAAIDFWSINDHAEGSTPAYWRSTRESIRQCNALGLRCRYDETGRCLEVHPCYGDDRTPPEDDCLGETEERAWSSPIFVEPAAARLGL